MENLTREQLVVCYNIVFNEVHSDGFKEAEMKDLLFRKGYYFISRPNEGWKSKLEKYLTLSGINLTETNLGEVMFPNKPITL